jgi:hypothetical protein
MTLPHEHKSDGTNGKLRDGDYAVGRDIGDLIYVDLQK